MAVESSLPPRYEIRTLGPEHTDWANAVVMHSTAFASPVWSKVYPEDKTGLCYNLFRLGTYLIDSGGKLHWDLDDRTANKDKLLEQMDFPLVSVAMAYDSYDTLDVTRLSLMLEVMPLLGERSKILKERDTRDPGSWEATGPCQVLFRNSTATRAGEEGKGFMGILARHMMREAAVAGFRGIFSFQRK